ncbi:MAG: TatD family hydrolase [Bdellovibrionales bacterium]|nr:TatD family hydrolase [Bdellovibrionales bacterium]
MRVDAHVHVSMFPKAEAESFLVSTGKKSIMAGYDQPDWIRQMEIKKSHPQSVVSCFGLHPWRVLEMTKDEIEEQMRWLEQNLIHAQACGETGLDFFRDPQKEKAHLQEEIFLRHLELNRQWNKPLVLHCVKAHGPLLDLLTRENFTGIAHGFSGSFEVAERYVQLGYKISVGRGVYHSGYHGLKEAVKKLPLEAILIESDSTFEDNEYPDKILQKVAETVAEIRSIPVEKVFEVTSRTAHEVFDIG